MAEVFRPECYAELALLEEGHFWFRNRNKLISWALKTYFPNANSLLEIGCGSGFVLKGLHQDFPGLKLTGSDIYAEGLIEASKRLQDVEFVQEDAKNLPVSKRYDVIGAFDVLEHIQEDELILEKLRTAINPSGGLLITVPQHKWLWSASDEGVHVRRYTAPELIQKLEKARFKVKRITSFVSLLLPLLITSRLLNTSEQIDKDPLSEFRIPAWLNFLLEQALNLETLTIQSGISYPCGGSLLAVATVN